MDVFPQYKLHELLPPHMDGQQFFTLLDLAPRIAAKRKLDAIIASQIGMHGAGEGDNPLEEISRVMSGMPKVRLKAAYANILPFAGQAPPFMPTEFGPLTAPEE